MSFSIPRPWATNDNYGTGPDVGTPTKVDPSSDANGFVAGVVAAPQHVNYLLHSLTRLARRQFAALMTPLSKVDLHGTTPSDGSESMGACSTSLGSVLLVKGNTGGVVRVADSVMSEIASLTTVAAITSECRAAVNNGSRILAIGVGGVGNAFSTNNGTSWTAGGALGLSGAALGCVWNGTHFIVSDNAATVRSTNGVAWAASTAGFEVYDVLAGFNGDMAALTGGTVVASGNDGGDIAFARSTNSGTTWAAAAGTVADPGDYAASSVGCIAGDGGDEIYWAGNDGTALNVFASADGNTWALRAALTGIAPAAAATPKLLMCQDTGALVAIVERATGGFAVHVSADRGFTWSALIQVPVGAVHAFGIANGRLFLTVDAAFVMSAGLGAAL